MDLVSTFNDIFSDEKKAQHIASLPNSHKIFTDLDKISADLKVIDQYLASQDQEEEEQDAGDELANIQLFLAGIQKGLLSNLHKQLELAEKSKSSWYFNAINDLQLQLRIVMTLLIARQSALRLRNGLRTADIDYDTSTLLVPPKLDAKIVHNKTFIHKHVPYKVFQFFSDIVNLVSFKKINTSKLYARKIVSRQQEYYEDFNNNLDRLRTELGEILACSSQEEKIKAIEQLFTDESRQDKSYSKMQGLLEHATNSILSKIPNPLRLFRNSRRKFLSAMLLDYTEKQALHTSFCLNATFDNLILDADSIDPKSLVRFWHIAQKQYLNQEKKINTIAQKLHTNRFRSAINRYCKNAQKIVVDLQQTRTNTSQVIHKIVIDKLKNSSILDWDQLTAEFVQKSSPELFQTLLINSVKKAIRNCNSPTSLQEIAEKISSHKQESLIRTHLESKIAAETDLRAKAKMIHVLLRLKSTSYKENDLLQVVDKLPLEVNVQDGHSHLLSNSSNISVRVKLKDINVKQQMLKIISAPNEQTITQLYRKAATDDIYSHLADLIRARLADFCQQLEDISTIEAVDLNSWLNMIKFILHNDKNFIQSHLQYIVNIVIDWQGYLGSKVIHSQIHENRLKNNNIHKLMQDIYTACNKLNNDYELNINLTINQLKSSIEALDEQIQFELETTAEIETTGSAQAYVYSNHPIWVEYIQIFENIIKEFKEDKIPSILTKNSPTKFSRILNAMSQNDLKFIAVNFINKILTLPENCTHNKNNLDYLTIWVSELSKKITFSDRISKQDLTLNEETNQPEVTATIHKAALNLQSIAAQQISTNKQAKIETYSILIDNLVRGESIADMQLNFDDNHTEITNTILPVLNRELSTQDRIDRFIIVQLSTLQAKLKQLYLLSIHGYKLENLREEILETYHNLECIISNEAAANLDQHSIDIFELKNDTPDLYKTFTQQVAKILDALNPILQSSVFLAAEESSANTPSSLELARLSAIRI